MPAYKTNENFQAPNVYRVKTTLTTLSEFTSQQFCLRALEYRTNKLEQGIQGLKSHEKSKSNSPIPI